MGMITDENRWKQVRSGWERDFRRLGGERFDLAQMEMVTRMFGPIDWLLNDKAHDFFESLKRLKNENENKIALAGIAGESSTEGSLSLIFRTSNDELIEEWMGNQLDLTFYKNMKREQRDPFGRTMMVSAFGVRGEKFVRMINFDHPDSDFPLVGQVMEFLTQNGFNDKAMADLKRLESRYVQKEWEIGYIISAIELSLIRGSGSISLGIVDGEPWRSPEVFGVVMRVFANWVTTNRRDRNLQSVLSNTFLAGEAAFNEDGVVRGGELRLSYFGPILQNFYTFIRG